MVLGTKLKTHIFTIKQAGPERAGELASPWFDTFRQAYEDVHTPENIRAYCDANFSRELALVALEDDMTVCSLAYKDDAPVGFSLVKHHACPVHLEGGSSELKQIYILSSQ